MMLEVDDDRLNDLFLEFSALVEEAEKWRGDDHLTRNQIVSLMLTAFRRGASTGSLPEGLSSRINFPDPSPQPNLRAI